MKNVNVDVAVASLLLLGSVFYLVQKNLAYLSVWLLLITSVLSYGAHMKYTPAVLLGIGTVMGVVIISGGRLRERFEDKNEEEKSEDNEKKSDDPEPHMDMGTTIMNAYKRMKPEQVQQMQEDTKELMETQQQLMETIGMLGPQVQQGAELVKTFQGMFGGNISDILNQ
jgi:hypothetical protein